MRLPRRTPENQLCSGLIVLEIINGKDREVSKSHHRCWYLCLVVLLTSQLVLAEDVQEAWRADFDDGNLDGAGTPVFINDASKKSEPDRLVFRSQDGVITLGGQFDTRDDYAELAWPRLPELSLKKNPMLEMRLRRPALDSGFWMKVHLTYMTAGGLQKTVSRYASAQAEWKTIAWRLAADGHLPQEWRPQTLVGLSIRVHSNSPAEVEIDWVRLRAFNITEQQREKEWSSLVSGGPPAEPDILREFFPFGVYDASSDIGRYHVTHRHAFEVMARHHLNYKQAGDIHPLALEAGEQTGMRMSVHNLRRMIYILGQEGTDAAIAFAKPSIDAVADSPVVIGYDIGDERPILDSWSAAAVTRLIEKLDPKRFSSLCFFTEPHIPAYNSFLCLYLTDIYPLGFHNRPGPGFLYEWSYNLAKQTNNKRHWVILQTFGNFLSEISGNGC